MECRKYRGDDIEEIAELFYETVHAVNILDYAKEQADVWAAWNQSLLENDTMVVVKAHRIIGFGDIDHTGYFGHLHVHKDYQGKDLPQQVKCGGILLTNYLMEK